MPDLKINGLPARVKDGATILDAAKTVYVEIPTLCHLKDCEPETSCMLCVVKDAASGQLVPSCSAKAVDGMEIDTECEEVLSARRNILNLLLSEHVGDCEAPCTRICPAHLDIPVMLREIARGNVKTAAWIAKRDLAIPVTLGHICPAPCEKGCRRAQIDESITIRELHRELEDDLGSLPALKGKAVAIVGSGAAGLACAWRLRLFGYACVVFDEASQAGGSLRNHEKLPAEVLEAEIESLKKAGIEFRLGSAISINEISAKFDGVVFAGEEFAGTHFTDAFYAEEHKLTVKAVANGKATALALDRFLESGATSSSAERFDSKVGKLRESEVQELAKNCSPEQARKPAAHVGHPDASGQSARVEAERCLHCDCRKPISCKLRKYAEQYGADQREFSAGERKHIQLIGHNESVVFEPGKCVKCGLCVRITKQAGEELGLTFVGRGFNTQVAVPFGATLQEGLQKAAKECVEVCPTGALAFMEGEDFGV